MGVHLSSYAVDIGLGGSIRDILVTQDWTCGLWPLCETTDTIARDLTDLHNEGTYSGTGIVRGISAYLPEGAMGAYFTGANGYVLVEDDGLSTGRNLSLANGRMEIAFFIHTTQDDATNRCIVHKQATNSTGNGWHVSLQNGLIEFYLKVGGSVVFNFQRGTGAGSTKISDGAWHHVVCYYDPDTNDLARIYIDGSARGADVTSLTTQGAYQATPLMIGRYLDGNGPFIGVLAYVMVGREGDTTLSARLLAASTWTTITSDVFSSRNPLTVSYGIASWKPWDLVAGTGTCTFTLNNRTSNSARLEGYYSVGHPNCRAGFGPGCPVRLTLTYGAYTKYWYGTIVSAPPEAGLIRGHGVPVVATDWFDRAALDFYGEAPTQAGQTTAVALGMLIDQASFPPHGVDLPAVGAHTLGYALDSGRAEKQPILAEGARVAKSEFGHWYLRGGVLTFAPGFVRQASVASVALDNTMGDLAVATSRDDVVNAVTLRAHPPTVDASATSVLYALTADAANFHLIRSGATMVIQGPYTDPSNPASRVGGTEMVVPVATTDYLANSLADGTGTNLTSALVVQIPRGEPGANVIRAYLTNTSSLDAYLTKFQVRGKGVYRYEASEVVLRDDASIRQHGERILLLDQPYQGSLSAGRSVADQILEEHAQPATRARSVAFKANASAALMTAAIDADVGDRISLTETVSGIVPGDGYFINHVTLTLDADRTLRCKWLLAPGWPERLYVSYTGDLSGTVDLDLEPLDLPPGVYALTFSRSGDELLLTGCAGGGGGGLSETAASGGPGTGGGGGAGGAFHPGLSYTTTQTTYEVEVGSGGLSDSGGATGGGFTSFAPVAGSPVLVLLGGAQGSGTTGGSSGLVSVGAGGVNGSPGGNGGSSVGSPGSNGSAGVNGTGGGGGGGAYQITPGGAGGNGGAGRDIGGGAGGGAGSSGTGGGSGSGGGVGTSSVTEYSGGGGGGGGGALIAGAYRGGGGGGGGAGQTGKGAGGPGGGGWLRIEKA